MKRCSKCHKAKILPDFHVKKDGSIGNVCKRCTVKMLQYKKDHRKYLNDYAKNTRPRYRKRIKKYMKKWSKNNKQYIKNYMAKYHKGWYERYKTFAFVKPEYRYRMYLTSAKKSERVFEISFEEFMQHFWQVPCEYCGSEIATVGIDRVDNSIGYTLLNTVPCCALCNWMKRSFPKDVFIEQCIKIAQKARKNEV